MGVYWRWDPEVARTIYVEYSGVVTWEDVYVSMMAYNDDLRRRGYQKVVIIQNLLPDFAMEPGLMRKVKKAKLNEFDELNMIVYMNVPLIFKALIPLLNIITLKHEHHFADSLDDARNLIRKSRRNYARRNK